MQLIKTKSNNKNLSKENQISEISSSLKSLAKDLDVPVFALSQLSRAVESRPDKRPILSDLRDSGSIEQDADIVMFIYRPEYYKITNWDDEEQASTANEAEIDIAKFRDGTTGVTRVGCELQFMRFIDIENKGQDVQNKYFKTIQKSFEIPKINPNEAFEKNNDVLF